MATPTNLPAAFVANTVLTAAQQNDLRGAFRTLQVGGFAYSSQQSSTSATYATTNLTGALTPQAATNKILINASIPISTDTAGGQIGIRITQTIGATTTVLGTWTYAMYNSAGGAYSNWNMQLLAAPGTTSATTILCEFARTSGTGIVYVNVGNTPSNLVLQEISA